MDVDGLISENLRLRREMKKTVCIFESSLKDGAINWFLEPSGQMVHILGKINIDRFKNKSYIVAKRGLTSNRPSVIFPNKDRDAGEQLASSSSSKGEQWEINSSVFFDVYPELKDKIIKCKCGSPEYIGY